MFAKVYALPSTHQKSAVLYGNIDTTTQKAGFDMWGHIVRTFQSMKIMIGSLRHHDIEMGLKILSDGWIGIFIKSKAGRGMLDKNIE